MALIITNHDLSTGSKTSSEVATPNNWRVTATVTGAKPSDSTHVGMYVEDAQGNWSPCTDDNGVAIKMDVKGNSTKSINAVLVNAPMGRVYCFSATGGIGTLNVDSNNA